MPVLEGKRMILFIAPKKTGTTKKTVEAESQTSTTEDATSAKPAKKAPQVKAKKEYTGPFVEGEEF